MGNVTDSAAWFYAGQTLTADSTEQVLTIGNVDANITLAAGQWVLWADCSAGDAVMHLGATAVAPTGTASANVTLPHRSATRLRIKTSTDVHAITATASATGTLHCVLVSA